MTLKEILKKKAAVIGASAVGAAITTGIVYYITKGAKEDVIVEVLEDTKKEQEAAEVIDVEINNKQDEQKQDEQKQDEQKQDEQK